MKEYLNTHFLKEIFSNKLNLLIIAIILIKILFIFITPTGRYGDDLVYLAVAKTMVITNNIAPIGDLATGTVFYGPPLQMWLLSATYILSLGDIELWFLFSKIIETLLFFGTLFVLYRIMGRLEFSESQKIITLGFFSFFPSDIFVSASMMEESLLIFLTAVLFWFLLKKEKKYITIFALSGFLMLSKYQAAFVILAALLTVIILKESRRTKILLMIALIFGSLVISGLWYYRNYVVLGDPLYHPGNHEYEIPTPKGSMIDILSNYYAGIWAIPSVSSISGKFLAADANIINLFRILMGLFFLPIIFIFAFSFWRFRKDLLYFAPLIFIMLFFSYIYMPVAYNWIDSRHFLTALPFFSLVLGYSLNFYPKIIIKKYFIAVFIAFLIISLLTTVTIAKNRAEKLSSFESLQAKYGNYAIKTYLRSDEMPNQTFLKAFLFIYKNIITENATYHCNRYEKEGTTSYCIVDNTINMIW